jgi:hypothetical protein
VQVRLSLAIGLEALEDFAALLVEYSEADCARRPVGLRRGADSGGGVGGLNFDFGDNGRAALSATAKN